MSKPAWVIVVLSGLLLALMAWVFVARMIVLNTDACPWPWQRVEQPREDPGLCISPQG